MQKTGREGFIMDQVSKYIVAAIKDVDAEVSVKDMVENFVSFRCKKREGNFIWMFLKQENTR